ncbi:MAG: hypothetical protein QXI11_04895 [Thermoproteota archaeon]|nr:hypothetical protein [Candidatus Brockarchaeota archaeon]
MSDERWKILIPKLAKDLKNRSSYEFMVEGRSCLRDPEGLYPVKSPDGRVLGQIYTHAYLEDVYFASLYFSSFIRFIILYERSFSSLSSDRGTPSR